MQNKELEINKMTSKRKNVPQSEFIFIIFIIYYFDISTFLRSLNYNFGKK